MVKRTVTGVLLILFIAGCVSLGKPSPAVKRFVLEYPPPASQGGTVIPETIKVERFSTARAFDRYDMIYRPEPFRYSSYNYCRWIANPGDMAADYLARDLRESGSFKAVFSYHDTDAVRYRLEGFVEEFFEDNAKKEAEATLSLYIILLDLKREEAEQRVVFRKTYRSAESCDRTPEGLARAMSSAMEKLSRQIMQDIHRELGKRGSP